MPPRCRSLSPSTLKPQLFWLLPIKTISSFFFPFFLTQPQGKQLKLISEMQVSRTRSPRWPVITAIFDPESSAAWKAYLSETQWTVHFEKAIMCEKWQKV